MKRYVEVEPICPFVGKPCIKDGWQHWDQKTLRPCAFWDTDIHNGIDPDEPCRIKRAINRILSYEISDSPDDNVIAEVPWDTTEE